MKDKTIYTPTIHFDRPYQRYLHIVWFALAYGAAGFVFMALIFASKGEVWPLMIPNLAMLLATVWLTALWTVLGAGSYWVRLGWSHFIAVGLVGVGWGLGTLIGITTDFGPNANDVFLLIVFVTLGVPVVSIAAQLPFWFFRLFFGWQIVYREEAVQESITLRDGFVVTFLFALAFAAPQIAFQVSGSQYYYGNAASEMQQVTNDDGTVSWESVEITDPTEIEQRHRTQNREAQMGMMFGFAVTAVYAFVFSLLNLPVLWWMFRSVDTGVGCGWVAGYALLWLLAPILLIGIFTGGWGGGGFAEVVGYYGTFLACYGAAISAPLAVSRNHGFRLTSAKREQRLINSKPIRTKASPFDDEAPATATATETEAETEAETETNPHTES